MSTLAPINTRILIVDDDPDIHVAINEFLYLLGYRHVIGVYDGKEALALLRSNAFHLIFLDINMPEMNGIELIHEIKKLSYEGLLCVISDHDMNVVSMVKRIAKAEGLTNISAMHKGQISINKLADFLSKYIPLLTPSVKQRCIKAFYTGIGFNPKHSLIR